jgi:cyclopropane fatty-acyl-phospholipid synthase-like methyltransferase
MALSDSPRKKEAEMVDGTWFDYFKQFSSPVFDDEVFRNKKKSLETLYGDFFDRNLSPEKGKLLSLGVGYGGTEIPLAQKGYHIIGIDSDSKVLELLVENTRKYAPGKIEAHYGDLYGDFQKDYIGKSIQACISFGVLEHFKREDLDTLIQKQFQISPLMICMMPINTPATLKAFKAEAKPEAHVDGHGIYRNFWPAEFWENEVLGAYNIVDKCFPTNHVSWGQVDQVTFAVRKD